MVHTVHKGCRGVDDTRHEERPPIIDGLGRAPPHPREAGYLTKYSNPRCTCAPRVNYVAPLEKLDTTTSELFFRRNVKLIRIKLIATPPTITFCLAIKYLVQQAQAYMD